MISCALKLLFLRFLCGGFFLPDVRFLGCWGWGDHMPPDFPEFDEEAFRQDIRDSIDKYSVGGGYAFAGFPIGLPGQNEAVARITEIMRDEVHTYGRKVYGYTGE